MIIGEGYLTTIDSCKLLINNDKIFLTKSKSTCQDLYLALKYTERLDFYRFASSLTSDLSKKEIEEILNEDNKLQIIYYYSKGKLENFASTEKKFTSDVCETILFRGVKLHCFNEVKVIKGDNMKNIITFLSFIRYTSNIKHYNTLLNKHTWAWEIIKDKAKIEFYDGTNWKLIKNFEPKLETKIGKCDYESLKGDAAFHTLIGDQNSFLIGDEPNSGWEKKSISVLCPKMLQADAINKFKKIHNAGVLYHEANHRFNKFSHNVEVNKNPKGNHVKCIIKNEETSGLDIDYVGTFGSQINYLLSLSKNSILDCDEREAAYDFAVSENDKHLCHVNPYTNEENRPRIIQERPICPKTKTKVGRR